MNPNILRLILFLDPKHDVLEFPETFLSRKCTVDILIKSENNLDFDKVHMYIFFERIVGAL